MTVNTATVARLKASLEEFEARRNSEAEHAARLWVDSLTNVEPLVRLEDYLDVYGNFDALGTESGFFEVMFNCNEGDDVGTQALEFFDSEFGKAVRTFNDLEAFANEAVKYWREIQKHMNGS